MYDTQVSLEAIRRRAKVVGFRDAASILRRSGYSLQEALDILFNRNPKF